jgi:hypothetical protein
MRLLILAGAVCLVAAVFLPVVCVFIPVGMSFAGGCASLWQISPVLGALMLMLIAGLTARAVWRPDTDLPSALLTMGLCLAMTDTLLVALLMIAKMIIHPYWLLAVIAAAAFILSAAFVAKRSGGSMRFHFHLGSLLLYISVAALALGILNRSLLTP